MPKSKEEIRKEATESAEDDLTKDIKHLLIDVHDELLQERGGNVFIKNLMFAQKRLASLIVRASIENDKLQQSLKLLTKQIYGFTIALFIVGIISISHILFPFLKSVFSFLTKIIIRIFSN